MPPARSVRGRGPLRWLPLSLAVTAAVAVLAALLLVPPLYRWRQLEGLTSADLSRREQSLNYVIRRGRDDPRVARGTIERLAVDDDANFRQILNALDRAALWRRPDVPDAMWLRWLALLAGEQDPEARLRAAQHLADMADSEQAGAVTRLLELLGHDPDADVRYNALAAAAQLAGPGGKPPFLALLAKAAGDESPTIARQAWIFLGLIAPPDARPDALALAELPAAAAAAVAEARLWALVRRTGDPAAALAVLEDPDAGPAMRAAAVSALGGSAAPAARQALRRLLTAGPDALTEANQVAIGRAILSIDAAAPAGLGDDAAAAIRAFAAAADDEPLLVPLRHAAIHRLPGTLACAPGTTQPVEQATRKLAAVEGALLRGGPVAHGLPSLGGAEPDLLHVLAVGAGAPGAAGGAEALRPGLSAEQPSLRDLACLVAAGHLSGEENQALVALLLRDYDDRAKMSGAVLAGLTGLEAELLEQRAAAEDIWAVERLMRLGLWMQGRLPQFDPIAPQLLARGDLPHSTLLLALLHRREPAALESLFNPRGEATLDLPDLLVRQRWWWVLRHHLAEDAPPLWLWADPGLQAFQIDVLRNWCLLHRGQTWAPPPGDAPPPR